MRPSEMRLDLLEFVAISASPQWTFYNRPENASNSRSGQTGNNVQPSDQFHMRDSVTFRRKHRHTTRHICCHLRATWAPLIPLTKWRQSRWHRSDRKTDHRRNCRHETQVSLIRQPVMTGWRVHITHTATFETCNHAYCKTMTGLIARNSGSLSYAGRS